MGCAVDVFVCNRRQILFGAALAAGIGLALTAVLGLAAPDRSFLHLDTNLSQALDRWSNFADIAVSPDGDRVAVIWPQAHEPGGTPPGSLWLRWASEGEGHGWSGPLRIVEGDDQYCVTRAAVAVAGMSLYTAHVAYIAQSPCASPQQQWLRYRTCSLHSGGQCGSSIQITSTTVFTAWGLRGVDIALDGQGEPHFVYVDYRWVVTENVGTVYYRRLSGGSPQPQERVSLEGQDCNNPAVACSNDYVHVVWENESANNEYGNFSEVHYARRTQGGGWTLRREMDQYGSRTQPPRNPHIAARGSTVVVAWDRGYGCSTDTPPPPCTRFTLAYDRSSDDGSTWLPSMSWRVGWQEVGTDSKLGTGEIYASKDRELWDYTLYLRPTVALDGQDRAVVVWHVNQGTEEDPDYDIYYTRAKTVTVQGFDWTTPTLMSPRTGGQSGSPVIAVAPTLSPSLHMVYLLREAVMGDWETFYGSDDSYDYPTVFLPLLFRNLVGGDGS